MAEVKGFDFDKKRALAGDAVCDCNGTAVTGLHSFPNVTPKQQSLYGVHDGDVCNWWDSGVFAYNQVASSLDLRMVTDGGPTIQDELVAALKEAHEALRFSYNVKDYPANGQTTQDAAMRSINAALARAGAL